MKPTPKRPSTPPVQSAALPTQSDPAEEPTITLHIDKDLAQRILSQLVVLCDEHGSLEEASSVLVAIINLLAAVTCMQKRSAVDASISGFITSDFEQFVLMLLSKSGEKYGLDFGKHIRPEQ